MSKGFDMLRDYIEHDALCMRRRKCCDFEYELQQEFAALEVENAKLRTQLADVTESMGRVEERCAKLRELCADIYKRFRGVVFECWAYSSEDFRMYERRMRELGLEVDEC